MSSSLRGQRRRAASLRTKRSRAGPVRRRAARVPAAGRRERRLERDLARPGAPLEQRRHRDAPVGGRLGALAGRHRHLHQLLRLGEGRRRDLRARRRAPVPNAGGMPGGVAGGSRLRLGAAPGSPRPPPPRPGPARSSRGTVVVPFVMPGIVCDPRPSGHQPRRTLATRARRRARRRRAAHSPRCGVRSGPGAQRPPSFLRAAPARLSLFSSPFRDVDLHKISYRKLRQRWKPSLFGFFIDWLKPTITRPTSPSPTRALGTASRERLE